MTLLHDGMYIDLGAHAHVYGQPPNQPTCYPYNNGKPSRRDFAFASSDLLPLVSDFKVGPLADLPVHGCLHLQLSVPHDSPKKTVITKPDMSIAERFDGVVKQLCEKQEVQPDTKTASAIRQVAKQTLQEHIRNKIDKYQTTCRQHIQAKDTSSAWGLWSRAIVEGFAEAWPHLAKADTDTDDSSPATKVDHARTYSMYGRPCFKRASLFTPQHIVDHKVQLAAQSPSHYTTHESSTLSC